MSELQAKAGAAVVAVAWARENRPDRVRVAAVKRLRETTGLGLIESVPLVDAALGKPGFIRATKERVVAGLVDRLIGVSECVAYGFTGEGGCKPEDVPMFQRRERWLKAAILRVAMAPTVD